MASLGYCNICGTNGPLTADHVPPKGASSLSAAETKTLIRHLSLDTQRPKVYQNGVKFPTLCDACNNGRLGGHYDPSLVDLTKDVSRIVRAAHSGTVVLPAEIKVGVKVHRVARSILGHLLAVLPYPYAGEPLVHAPFPDAMREYFLDQSRPLPDQMSIYYWIYPSDLHVVARGFGISDARNPAWIVGDMIKFFPLGYWVTWEAPRSVTIPLPQLIANRAGGIDDVEDLRIPLRNVPPLGWPERPGAWGMNMFSDEMTFVAYPRKRRRRKGRR